MKKNIFKTAMLVTSIVIIQPQAIANGQQQREKQKTPIRAYAEEGLKSTSFLLTSLSVYFLGGGYFMRGLETRLDERLHLVERAMNRPLSKPSPRSFISKFCPKIGAALLPMALAGLALQYRDMNAHNTK